MTTPRFSVGVVHGYHINDDGSSPNKRSPEREPAPEWTVYDRAFNVRPIARFNWKDAEEKATRLAAALNEENETSLSNPGFYEPNFQAIIDAATARHESKDGRMRRNKGLRGEREAKLKFAKAGYSVRNLDGKGDHRVHGHPLGDLHLEVKRQELLDIMRWMRQAEREAEDGTIPIVVFRRSREPWYVVLPLDDFLGGGRDGDTESG
jgi:hypothetical protein